MTFPTFFRIFSYESLEIERKDRVIITKIYAFDFGLYFAIMSFMLC